MDRRELLKQAVYDMCATCVFCIVATFAMAASAEVATSTVESGMGYSSWPMIQAVGERIVCVYSRGTAHSIVQGVRDAFAKWSADGGRTWSQPVAVAASPEYGETPIGKGLDKDGAALFWVRAYGGGKPHHELYRTRDGEFFELVSTPELSPLPMQITDIFAVDNGLMCLWFATGYSSKVSNSSWGTLFSADNGRTWKQTAVESNLPLAELPTEPSVARLPDGKLICIARSETLKGDGARQWQMESADGGLTWTRKATNIRDVFASTPSLIFDVTSGLLYNYYYERGKGVLKRRVARPDSVVGNPLAWPEPEVVARGSDAPWDAGNANATSLGDTHYVAFYSGVEGDTSVVVAAVPTLLISSCDDAFSVAIAAQLASASDIAVDGCADVRVSRDVVTVMSTGAVSFVRLKLKESLAPEVKVLNDAWERSYGDLKWQTLGTNTVYSPWYFLAEKDGKTQGYGAETGPAAMCCWEVSAKGVALVLDVRAGGRPVRLNGRTLKACKIVRAESKDGETPWQFGRRFCRMMCPNPKLPKEPVYGYNDWYCAYGKNTATNFLEDAAAIVSLCDGLKVRPYVVMDDGWQKNSPPVVRESGRGPWDAAGANFGMEMPEFCRRIAALGAKPGLWYRPLRAWDELPAEQKLLANAKYLDPTVPAVKSRIAEDMRRFRDWGFKLVKIDFLSFDIAQLWPCDPHPHHDRYIQDNRAWRYDSRTTAEVMRDLYVTMKDAAGDDVVIIGCNALNHLAAGVFELQRTGNDTSGKNWAWTKNHGVNTLAMRSIQDGAFFKIDADCVGLASEGAVPWALNRQWMDLLGRSGTPFFVSWSRALMNEDVRKSLREAFKAASEPHPTAEAYDWQMTPVPRRWSVGTFDWDGEEASSGTAKVKVE